eukprot:NODE_4328_length_1080_cov_62.764890_g4129_i0.p1 GENE.NODE_4328_length_1080_cov_62.764890_g4129_i0~~NODE_4328_length_1080_cov_62.764890_g4129_i0.p1  ORF type:complete len:220 (+),score=8.32 NODE_4328_length_1080_cov_62.764890_g4129_i0:123-782(+)
MVLHVRRRWRAPEGSWKCGICQNYNFPLRNSCNRCHVLRLDTLSQLFADQGGGHIVPPVAASAGRDQAQLVQLAQLAQQLPPRLLQDIAAMPPLALATPAFQPPLGSWRCPVESCRNVNFPQRSHCNRCAHTQPPLEGGKCSTPPSSKLKPGCWFCPRPHCGNVNFPFRDACESHFVRSPSQPRRRKEAPVFSFQLKLVTVPSVAGFAHPVSQKLLSSV